jgi:hypothetical protein
MDELIDKVIDQIKSDMLSEDYTAIEELLKSVPIKNLQSFLSEVCNG